MVTDRVGPTITTLKAEVDFLSDELRQAKAENKQLLEENSSLSTWQCVYTDGKTGLAGDEHGNQYCVMARENERLREELDIWKSVFPDIAPQNVIPDRSLVEQENERLRAALRPFAEAADGFDMPRIKNPEEWFAYRGIVSATEAKGAITVGDLRRARAALEGK